MFAGALVTTVFHRLTRLNEKSVTRFCQNTTEIRCDSSLFNHPFAASLAVAGSGPFELRATAVNHPPLSYSKRSTMMEVGWGIWIVLL